MFPRRFSVAAKYFKLRSKGIDSLPSLREMLYFLLQPSARRRGTRFIERIESVEGQLDE